MEKKEISHVTIIMDGNGRWAKQKGRERLYGHRAGAESVRACIETSVKRGVKYLSLYAFSEENWARPKAEVEGLMTLMVKALVDEMPNLMKNDIRLLVIGNRARLSDKLNRQIDKSMQASADNKTLTVILFVSYSGKWDILQAVQRYAQDFAEGKQCEGEGGFEGYLSTYGIPDPDLLIRTSGEQRISNFMLWQCAYTEYYFTEILWPDFRGNEFEQALDTYYGRDRRYGKV